MSTPIFPPYEETLIFPYSAYPATQLAKAKYAETAIWGLGVRAVRPYAIFVIEPWDDLSINDYHSVRIQDLNNPASSAVVEGEQKRYNLIVAEENMPEGEVPMFGRVVRAGSLQESRSVTQTILIKTTLPGGVDRRVWEPWHSDLFQSLEGLPEGSIIDANIAETGVWCLIKKYLNIRKNDVITVVVDGIAVEHIVSPAEAAGRGPIRVFIGPDIFAQISQFGPVGVVFKVRDVVENVSGGKYPYSKPYMLESELDDSLLDYPLLFCDGVECPLIDLDTQSQSVFTVEVTLPRKTPTPNPRHQVNVILAITQADGTTRTVRLPAVADRNLRGESILLSNDLLTSLAGGWFRVTFEWKTASGVLIGSSASYTVQVVGTPVLMPQVTVSPMEAGLIPVGKDLTVTIPEYQPHDAKWLETLVIQQLVAGGGGERYVQLQPAGVQGGTRRVTKEVLKGFEGKGPFEIYYITDDGKGTASSIRESLRLEAQVGARIEDLPEAIVQGAIGNNIDPADVQASEVLMMFPYAETRDGDVLSWSVIGKGQAGSASGTIHITGATAGGILPTVEFPADRKILDNNIDAGISVTYSIERPGPPRAVWRSKVLNLSVGQYVHLEVPYVPEAGPLQQQLSPEAVFNGATVRVAFKPMRADDQIFVKWLGAYGISDIEVLVPGNPKTNAVEVVIPPEVIAKGIRQNGNKITVQYSFTRGMFTYKSEVLTLDLLPLAVLPTPIIDGIGDTKVLPLYLLSDTARTRIAPWSLAHKDQRIWMTYEGTFDDDSPFIEKTYTANLVTAAGVTNGIAPPTPTDKLLRLKVGSRLTIRFWISFAQSTDQSTAVLVGVREHLIQGVPATLQAPAFANRAGPTLSIYPLDYETTASVRVAYTGMRSTQSIQVQWIYPDAEIADIPVQNGVDKGFIDVPVSQKILASSVGKIITLRYIATINGVQIESATQTLKIETIRAADLPRPLLNGVANDGVLDLNTFADDALAAVAKWRLSVTGQRVWLTCSSPHVADLVVLDGIAISAVEAVKGLANIAVLRGWLQRVKSRQITVTCKVTFDGSRDEQTAIPFLKSTYEIEWQKGIIDSINVGSQPHYIVITRDGSTAYVTNHGSHSVSVIDVPKRKVIRTIDGFNNPFRIVLHPDESRLYVGNLGAKTISVVDTRNDAIIQTIPGFNSIWGLAINASGTLLFANCSIDSRVFVHDAKTGARLASTYVENPFGLELNPLQTALYSGGPTKLSILKPAAVEGVIKEIGGFNPALNMAFTPHDLPFPHLYVAGWNAVVIVNSVTHVIYKTLGGFYNTYAVTMNPRVHECYVSSAGTSLTVISTDTQSIVRTHTGFSNPAGGAVEPTGKVVLVANQASGTVSFVAV